MTNLEPKNETFKNDQSSPLITIIVAVFNGAKTLQCCIDSVTNQTYPYKELIIMDGDSTDGTVDILKANESHITYWESEPDRGIYHAWNKALKKATGEWVCFLGADDYWAHNYSLEKLIKGNSQVDLISSKMAMINKKGIRVIGEPWVWKRMKRGQKIAHPGMLHRRALFDKLGCFNEKYSIAGDYEFLLRLKNKVNVAFLDEITVCVGAEGISQTKIREALLETMYIQACHQEIGPINALINYYLVLCKITIRKVLRIY